VVSCQREKGITIKTGQTHVQRFMPELLEFIEQGRAASLTAWLSSM
jgi:hypothetical protein